MPGAEVAEGTGEYAGFYSRGLTLVEATSGPHIIERLRYWVESRALAHTISRDDVVHDDAYAKAKQSGDAWWLPMSCSPIEQHLRMVEATIADPDAAEGWLPQHSLDWCGGDLGERGSRRSACREPGQQR